MKILLVEDHADSRRNLQRLIERRGHEVVAVASAEEAEGVLTTQRFPFLILDWMLPGKSGVDLCRELRAQDRGDEMFILLVTARADTDDLQQAQPPCRRGRPVLGSGAAPLVGQDRPGAHARVHRRAAPVHAAPAG